METTLFESTGTCINIEHVTNCERTHKINKNYMRDKHVQNESIFYLPN